MNQNRPKGDDAPRMEQGEGRMDGWTDFPYVLQDSFPFWAAVQKKKRMDQPADGRKDGWTWQGVELLST